jgi:hypothetical protein
MDNDRLLRRLAATDSAWPAPAPARLKARIYSALVETLSAEAPLLSLATLKASGSGLCVFEHAVAVIPFGEPLGTRNPCRVCHARVLAERLEHAPIFWPHCPYAEFHRKT